MIAVDTQILVFAHRADTTWHERARDRIRELAEGQTKWAIPMHCLVEFYAKATHARIHRPPSTPDQAMAQIDAWLEAPTLAVLGDGPQTWSTMRGLIEAAKIRGEKAYDARIAAVCLQHGVTELWTTDRDFLDYPALRLRNPLIDIEPTKAGERRAMYGSPQRPTKSRAKTKRR